MIDPLDYIETYPDDDDDKQLEWFQEHYRFYILNDDQSDGYGYEFWTHNNGREFPVIQSNTSGVTGFYSWDADVGKSIEPTERFFDLIAMGFDEYKECPYPDSAFYGAKIIDLAEEIYDEKIRDYEVWMAIQIINWFEYADYFVPELEPVLRWTREHTEHGIPALDLKEE